MLQLLVSFFDAARQDETKRVQELSKDGRPVRFNEKTGEYEIDPNFVDPEDAEEERGVAGELTKKDVTMSPGRMQAQFGTSVLPRPKLADEPKPQPKDKPKVELGDPEEERGIAGELTKKTLQHKQKNQTKQMA